jgi:hypothetical protein
MGLPFAEWCKKTDDEVRLLLMKSVHACERVHADQKDCWFSSAENNGTTERLEPSAMHSLVTLKESVRNNTSANGAGWVEQYRSVSSKVEGKAAPPLSGRIVSD